MVSVDCNLVRSYSLNSRLAVWIGREFSKTHVACRLSLKGAAFLIAIAFAANLTAADTLDEGFANPPPESRLRAYWWWLNGNVTKEAITRDLEAMKAKGFGGALICDADGSSQDGNARAPHGPTFFSPAWRELYQHTLREADRLGLEMSLNIQSGWNLGGPMVTPDDAPKKLVWTEVRVTGPTNFSTKLAQPTGRDGYYRDLFVLAHQVREPAPLPWEPVTMKMSFRTTFVHASAGKMQKQLIKPNRSTGFNSQSR